MLGPLTVHTPGASTVAGSARGSVAGSESRIDSGQSGASDMPHSRGRSHDLRSFQSIFSDQSTLKAEQPRASDSGAVPAGDPVVDEACEQLVTAMDDSQPVEDELDISVADGTPDLPESPHLNAIGADDLATDAVALASFSVASPTIKVPGARSTLLGSEHTASQAFFVPVVGLSVGVETRTMLGQAESQGILRFRTPPVDHIDQRPSASNPQNSMLASTPAATAKVSPIDPKFISTVPSEPRQAVVTATTHPAPMAEPATGSVQGGPNSAPQLRSVAAQQPLTGGMTLPGGQTGPAGMLTKGGDTQPYWPVSGAISEPPVDPRLIRDGHSASSDASRLAPSAAFVGERRGYNAKQGSGEAYAAASRLSAPEVKQLDPAKVTTTRTDAAPSPTMPLANSGEGPPRGPVMDAALTRVVTSQAGALTAIQPGAQSAEEGPLSGAAPIRAPDRSIALLVGAGQMAGATSLEPDHTFQGANSGRGGAQTDRDHVSDAPALPTRANAIGAGVPAMGAQAVASPVQILSGGVVSGQHPEGDTGRRTDSTVALDLPLPGEARVTPGSGEVRAASLAGSAQGQTPQTARQIAVQISEAVARGADRPINLTLNPAELGRVRISLSAGDGVMLVSVLAERPETLDLMRRNIDMLAQEFRNIGYDGSGFSFAQDAGGSAGNGEDGDGHRATPGDPPDRPTTMPAAQIAAVPTGPTDRLDIRL